MRTQAEPRSHTRGEATTGSGDALAASGTPLSSACGSMVPCAPADWPTIWGLDLLALHDRFWASHGVCVVRRGVALDSKVTPRGYLLIGIDAIGIFDLHVVARRAKRSVKVVLEVKDGRRRGCRETTETGNDLQLVRFRRDYDRPDRERARWIWTTDRELARSWAAGSATADSAFETLTRAPVLATRGHVYNARDGAEVMEFVRDLLRAWRHPEHAVPRIRSMPGDTPERGAVWLDETAVVPEGAAIAGPIWVGSGRTIGSEESVVGPAVLWDAPESRPEAPPIEWHVSRRGRTLRLPSAESLARPVGAQGKRVFDIAFSLIALALTLPIYPFVMLLIWIQDGRPFFFIHRRQTFGGREFPCLKFRTMKNNAEVIKKELQRRNQADGPQFFMENDPRLLPCGRFLRKAQIDELPQFFNVLLGHMSVVGPRPSPFDENQFSPSWRQARLTARPGVTGLWQVCRTRRQGEDFQEWIRYDIEYVEKASWRLDLWIIYRTMAMMARDFGRLGASAARRLPFFPKKRKADTVPKSR
jgi:lipopolysaccharide/colanic/teichoic acid biosynthesis glycosyltransferase